MIHRRRLELIREEIRILQPDELRRIAGGPPAGHEPDPDDRIGPYDTDTCTVETYTCTDDCN